ncbi:hypothetical protein XENTR_v10009155 [Xenopus tropicalis]|nr:hypothetical protein XENTR_v10009155 [Xenopus tropicalis]
MRCVSQHRAWGQRLAEFCAVPSSPTRSVLGQCNAPHFPCSPMACVTAIWGCHVLLFMCYSYKARLHCKCCRTSVHIPCVCYPLVLNCIYYTYFEERTELFQGFSVHVWLPVYVGNKS